MAYAPDTETPEMEAIPAPPTGLVELDEGMRAFAEAWIDRWCALGGSFGIIYKPDGTADRPVRGMPMSYTWTPPAAHNPALRPHEWITDPADHTGAVKALEGMLTLVPGGSKAVLAVAEELGLFQWRSDQHG